MKLLLIAFFNSLFLISFAQTTFIEDTQNMFIGTDSGESFFVDVDGDDDLDIFITGYAESFDAQAQLYLNDGTGIFSEASTTIPKLGYSSAAFADVDNDGDMDILVAGQGSGINSASGTYLYLNDGIGNFTNSNVSFIPLIHTNVGFADIDNDNDQDIIVMGIKANFLGLITAMYVNDGSGNYSLSANEFTTAYQGGFDFADIDDDNDLDVIITGSTGENFESASTLYENDGAGNYTKVEDAPFEDVNISSVDFADLDGDLDQDVIITGSSVTGRSTSLYINNGLGEFVLKENTGLVRVIFGDCSLADVDLDGDIDILIIGRQGPIPDETGKLYINDGNANFTEDQTSIFTGATGGSVDLGDIDGDGDLDAFIIGLSPDQTAHSKLYINDLTLGTESPSLAFQMKVFPNPCTDFLILETEFLLDEVTIEMTNSSGQAIRSSSFKNVSKIEIPVHMLSAGLYFLKISNANNYSQIVSFVKEN